MKFIFKSRIKKKRKKKSLLINCDRSLACCTGVETGLPLSRSSPPLSSVLQMLFIKSPETPFTALLSRFITGDNYTPTLEHYMKNFSWPGLSERPDHLIPLYKFYIFCLICTFIASSACSTSALFTILFSFILFPYILYP